jgi:hypothetical protein
MRDSSATRTAPGAAQLRFREELGEWQMSQVGRPSARPLAAPFS